MNSRILPMSWSAIIRHSVDCGCAIARRHGTRSRNHRYGHKQTDLGWNFGGGLYAPVVDWIMAEERALEPTTSCGGERNLVSRSMPRSCVACRLYVAQPVRIIGKNGLDAPILRSCFRDVVHSVAQQAIPGREDGLGLRAAQVTLAAMQQGASQTFQLFGPV